MNTFGEEYDVSRHGTGSTTSSAFEDFYETQTEQNLAEDMYDELCQKYGLKCWYFSRVFQNMDGIFGEDTHSLFSEEYSFPVKLYPLDFTKYNPSSAFNKSQYTTNDSPTFHVVKKRLAYEAQKHGLEDFEPKPGDIFLIEMTKDIWAINFSEPEAQYYDRGEAFVWEFMCERFSISGEEFNTGNEDLDTLKDVDNLNIYPDKDEVTGDNLRLDDIADDKVNPIIDQDEEIDIWRGC